VKVLQTANNTCQVRLSTSDWSANLQGTSSQIDDIMTDLSEHFLLALHFYFRLQIETWTLYHNQH
jgi:hypothetical protein